MNIANNKDLYRPAHKEMNGGGGENLLTGETISKKKILF